MRIGTKTLLFGCHQFILHPIFVWLAWRKIYGRPSRWMWVAFILHDWGLWGMKVFDGPEDNHPWRSANLIPRWVPDYVFAQVFLHSRFFAAKNGMKPSKLCWADKLGSALMPSWLWAILAHLSGEGYVYMLNSKYEINQNTHNIFSIRGLVRFHKKYKGWAEKEVSRELSTTPR